MPISYQENNKETGLNLLHWGKHTPYLLCSDRYDLKDTSRITLVDLQLISAMGPPGGGRNAVTSRFLRHFNISSINAFSDDTMVRIFSNLVAFYLRNNEFPPEYFTAGNQIVTATMEVSPPKTQPYHMNCSNEMDERFVFHALKDLINHILFSLILKFACMLLIPEGL